MSSRPKDKFTRTVTKRCPACKQQIPVACRSCPCGHVYPARRTAAKLDPPAGEVKKRRMSERTKKERPSYYESIDLRLVSTARRRTTSTCSSTSPGDGRRRGRGRPKGSQNKPKTDSPTPSPSPSNSASERQSESKEEDNSYDNLSAEKSFQYSIILAEINRKFCSQGSQPR
ncbi:UPF0547 protein C16orf87 homolog [Lingula anatina]|uniref:UPF0547 protein C16orf87 homolog n=1 Tax=Lingula anatina TaxID=7574 RepID=A0A1S3GYS0_LINAN|nr:UPF0547 protein C16orf87 homolog [Lingula anatina]|eukprot:XP_013378812.1 UPF0547 protein C16orf87 homolog [Lingula anatina]